MCLHITLMILCKVYPMRPHNYSILYYSENGMWKSTIIQRFSEPDFEFICYTF